ncbi:hypothetical protein, partial [Bacillus thermotolerans]|uniref:hypothetical protein n=1 Tax=Bacillus thermotolerans TaxID=1221996 RepID=UPI001E451DA8
KKPPLSRILRRFYIFFHCLSIDRRLYQQNEPAAGIKPAAGCIKADGPLLQKQRPMPVPENKILSLPCQPIKP